MKKLLISLALCMYAALGMAQNIPAKPTTLVNDYTNTLSAEQIKALEDKLVAYDDSTSTQMAIVLINTLDGYDVSDLAYRYAEAWGIGNKGKNNGLLILAAIEDRRINIQIGYGLEGAITDGLSKRVIENDIKPNFKNGQYYEGLDAATTTLISMAKGEYKADADYAKRKKKGGSKWLTFIIFGAVILLFIVGSGGGLGGGNQIRRNGMSNIPLWMLLSGGSGGFGGGSFGGGGGSSGGGGFGGFGGGSFGGGGSSGNW